MARVRSLDEARGLPLVLEAALLGLEPPFTWSAAALAPRGRVLSLIKPPYCSVTCSASLISCASRRLASESSDSARAALARVLDLVL